MKSGTTHTNRLITENSPYLLQHAHNPVDWFPWSSEAFERAREEDKPVFLSAGYSTCHWCHVMERESFEDEETARVLNAHFVSIKLDREERPDIDQIYMDAVVAMTGMGGWPLSVFLTPEGKPFYGGTYFPPREGGGRPAFRTLLLAVADAWKSRRKELLDSAGRMTALVERQSAAAAREELSRRMLTDAPGYFRGIFDAVNGGFGGAPKFPQPAILSMLLYCWYLDRDETTLEMVEKTLDAMARGGIYDHLGGGFHRYSTDERWLVPHFEKMLYDQALLAKVYVEAFQATGNRRYAVTARGVLDYVLRDMRDKGGGFYAAEDADSEGREGAFYFWAPRQIASVLPPEEAEVFNAYYGITEEGNFQRGESILSVTRTMEHLAKRFNKTAEDVKAALEKARATIRQSREKRARPGRDDKVIAAWNGLMISALAAGGAALDEAGYIAAAGDAAEFILGNLRSNARLMRYYRDGRVVEKAFLDDYACMVMGLVDLYEATFDAEWLNEAITLSEEMIELFADEDEGGFFLTGKDGEKTLTRPKPFADGATPSGNSVAALALLKLGRLTQNRRFAEQGASTIEAASPYLARLPGYAPAMLVALGLHLGPAREIVIAGSGDATGAKRMLGVVRRNFLPNAVVILHEQGERGSKIEQLVPFVKEQTAIDNKTSAYVCEDYVCKQPVNDVKEFERVLKSPISRQN